ncbi:unnamed protein product, partial [Polarella glacialis]
ALQLWDELARSRHPADLIAFGAALAACHQAGRWDFALALLRDMRTAALRPDAISFAASVGSCEQSGEFRPVLELLASLAEE